MKLDEAIEFSDDHQVMFPPFSFFADFVVSHSYKVNHPIAFEGEGELPGVHRKVIQKPLNLVMLFAILCHRLLLEMFMLRMIRVQLMILNPINKVNSASESSPQLPGASHRYTEATWFSNIPDWSVNSWTTRTNNSVKSIITWDVRFSRIFCVETVRD